MQTLLIVEDEKLIRQGIKVMVQRSGVPIDNILECSNGEAALEIIKMQKVDVMFTDIRMPKMNGIELVQAVQELKEKPLIVAVSGFDDFSYAVEMMRMGTREYLLKPVDREKVKEILEKLNSEIEQGNESARRDRNLGCRQLKYAIIGQSLTQPERELLRAQYGEGIISRKFVLVCTNESDLKIDVAIEMPYFYLDDIEGNEIFITDNSYLPILLREEAGGKYVGISETHSGLDELKDAYVEALAARKEAFYLGKNECHYEEMLTRKETSLHLEEKFISQIVQLLGTDKYEDAIRSLTRVFKNARLGGYQAIEIEKSITQLLDGVLTTYANVLKTEKSEVKDFYTIYSYNCLDEFEAELMGWISTFCDTLNSQFDDYKNKQKIKQAMEYIRENYDRDLNMAVVSNHISMNYSLFSYVFKQYTGNNFVNFLKEIRIEEAKRLLEETDMKVIDISAKVGYENEKHFMKTFKATCGVSPTEYRKNMQFKK